jgi:hypothetical protein
MIWSPDIRFFSKRLKCPGSQKDGILEFSYLTVALLIHIVRSIAITGEQGISKTLCSGSQIRACFYPIIKAGLRSQRTRRTPDQSQRPLQKFRRSSGWMLKTQLRALSVDDYPKK